MSNIPPHLYYTDSHEWVSFEQDGSAHIGISDHAQKELGDLVFVELPAVGEEISQGDPCAVVESVKAASDIFAPVSGKVIAINEELDADPGIVNVDPYNDGWLFQLELSDKDELNDLKSAKDYEVSLAE